MIPPASEVSTGHVNFFPEINNWRKMGLLSSNLIGRLVRNSQQMNPITTFLVKNMFMKKSSFSTVL